ncbi:hypothetical protein [Microbacterium sp.]|uniref:hypothetical protein n=1 Tax=Microbacterium sp. TaxID=51671 RepID=UPI003A8FF043
MDDLRSPGYLRAPIETKPTAFGLWLHTDVHGRRELVPELIAGDLYPGQAAVDLVVDHLLKLDESGFLRIYQAGGREWIQLENPLRADMRNAPESECPPPPRDLSRHVAAVGGERVSVRERAEEQVREEQAERVSQWAAWEQEQERSRLPARPLLLDAPPIGCPDHPNGRYADCGPCGTARRRHDKWVQERRYAEQLAKVDEL